MPRSTIYSRLHILALLLVWSGWMFTSGQVFCTLANRAAQRDAAFREPMLTALFTSLLAVAAWAMLNSRLPELSRRAALWATHLVGVAGLLGVVFISLGALFQSAQSVDDLSIAIRGTLGLAGIALLVLAPIPKPRGERLFLLSRGNASDFLARRNLMIGAAHAVLVGWIAQLSWDMAADSNRWILLDRATIAYIVGTALLVWQRYPQRMVGFLPIAAIAAAIALLAAWIDPTAEWPILMLAFSLGVGHLPPRADLIASVAASQRTFALLTMAASQMLGIGLGWMIIAVLPSDEAARAIRFFFALCLAAAASCFLLRELIELAVEPILFITHPIRSYGPGRTLVPTRGPVVVIANHAAWFDPLWIAKVMPLRLRPLMTSRFYDLPLISWLMRKVFHTIRVQEGAFRREAPEIAEAIAALERGENVLIFPEGWLRRKDEVPLRRFGQGVYQILRNMPQTPIVVCWIEGNWGSYFSFKDGPPTKNKKFDLFHRIKIAVNEPEVLPLEMLQDHHQTRRHLMHACARARTHLGLPEVACPAFGTDEDE